MKQSHLIVPGIMGGLMGLMMLAMAHLIATDQSDRGAAALLIFVAAHVVGIGAVAVLALWATRFAPRLRRRLSQLHNLSRRHVTAMLGAAMIAALGAHLVQHGGH